MKRILGFAVLGLGVIGLAGCLAGLIALWVVRPTVLQSSDELLDTADRGLKIVEEKTTRADELLKALRGIVDPVASKIAALVDKGDEQELNRLEEALSQRLGQVDALVEMTETAVTFLNRTPKLTKSLLFSTAPGAMGQAPVENSQDSAKALSRLATALKNFRETLAKFRENKQGQKEFVDRVVRLAREVDSELQFIESKIERVRQRAAEFGTEVAELRTTVPTWIHWAVVLGSVVLVWMGLGQFTLARWGWHWIRAPTSK